MATNENNVTVRVRIAGEDHFIKGNASSEYICQLAEKINESIQLVQKNNPNLTRQRAAILVAINLVDELEKLKQEHNELLKLMDEAN